MIRWVAALGAFLFLYGPLAIVVAYSFNDSVMNAQWVGFTLAWYRKLFANEEMLTAAWNSLVIGLTASAVSTVLGTMAGYAMHRWRLRLLPVLVLAPIAIPEILMGVSLLIFFVAINLTLGLVSLSASASSPAWCAPGWPAWTRVWWRRRAISERLRCRRSVW